MDVILYVVGFANVVLQLLTRNIGFGVFGMICVVISAFSLVPKFKRIALITRLVLLFSVISYCLYCHTIYGDYVTDYIVIIIEAILCVGLSIAYSLPKKEPPSIEGGSACLEGKLDSQSIRNPFHMLLR